MASEWAICGGKIGGKVVLKVACNFVVPGSGSLVEFAEAGICFYDGDSLGGVISIVSGVADLFSAGLYSIIKNAMKETAKGAVKQTAKETAKSAAKETTKKVGQDLSKQLAMGAIKNGGKEAAIQTARETAKTASKEATKKVGQQIGKEIARGVVTETVEDALSASTKITLKTMGQAGFFAGISSGGHDVMKTAFGGVFETTLEKLIPEMMKQSNKEFVFGLTKDAATTAAKEEFAKHSYKFIVKDAIVSDLKGGINYSAKTHDQ